ncbi:TVP38/TMEM64 family protein [Bacillus sp. FJAT-42376]|uniref:TVP38/TMEM64 family protein n=1 Tax=Bacillus sp. FJAT-42376 TaxID=2014076 RepID=UPI001F154100|nr:TVP38/TMEM64 family protein [Bacillus sp. FJAT-42376]
MKRISKWLLLAAVIGLLFWLNERYLNLNPGMIKDWILSLGAAGPLVFILVYTFRPLILFPASILSLAGGLAFGSVYGFIYTLIGAAGGALVAFFLSKAFGAKVVPDSEKIESVKKIIEKNGFLYVLVLRILPIVNFDLISYAAGLTSIRWAPFLAATVVGIMPGTFAYNFLGSSFTSDNQSILIIAIVIFALLALIPIIFRKKIKQRLFAKQGKEVEEDA